MTAQVEFACPDHPDARACPDKLVVFSGSTDEYGLLIHDGEDGYATSSITIAFCPWCGSQLPLSKRASLLD